jgi:hypothetical protein
VNPQVAWWREVGAGPAPQNPLLVVAVHDDPTAVSALSPGHGATWPQRETPTSRVAAHLDVPVFVAGTGDLPEGHDLLLLASAGRGMTTLAASVAVTHFAAEPQLVVGYGSGIDDQQWMDKVQDVRTRTDAQLPEPIAQLVQVLQEADVPVLLDGVVSAAAAAIAGQPPPVQAPVCGDEPVQRFFLDRCEAGVWGTSGIGPGEGLGALSGLATLRLALLAAS